MILYHGSNILISAIDISRCKPYKDFGKGFYLTEIEEQAYNMSRRTAFIYGGKAVVSRFEFDINAAINDSLLKIKHFKEPNEEWALFVLANRSKKNEQPAHDYDIVIGPVADDAIATLFRNFDNGIIDLSMLVNSLKYKEFSSQYFFHTPNATTYLKQL